MSGAERHSRAVLLHAAEEAGHAPVVADPVLLVSHDVAALPVVAQHALLVILQATPVAMIDRSAATRTVKQVQTGR